VVGDSGAVPPGDVAEGQGGPDVDAAGRVVPAHHAGLVAAGRVQAGHRVARSHAKLSNIFKLLRKKRMLGALIGQFANTSTLFLLP
jgi:hypothetical protein